MQKHRPPLEKTEVDRLVTLEKLDFTTYSESEVRETYVRPLLEILGYRKESEYSVSTPESFKLNKLFSSIGSKRIELDYLTSVRKQFFWLIETKNGKKENIGEQDISQAYFYSLHPEVDSIYFAVCNGWYFNLYERDKINNKAINPLLSIKHSEISKRFLELDKYIGATQILSTLKENLLNKIKKVLSAEVLVERLSEFVEKVQTITREVKPIVLDNFRKNAKNKEKLDKEYEVYLKSCRPFKIVDSLFESSITAEDYYRNARILTETEHFKHNGDQYLLFYKLFLIEIRPVSYRYYIGLLSFLVHLYEKDIKTVHCHFNDKTGDIEVIELIIYWIEQCYGKFPARKELRLLSLFEGLIYRLTKLLTIMLPTLRELVLASVTNQKYFTPEEILAFQHPCPAGQLIIKIESITCIACGKFIDAFYDKKNRMFKENLALQEYNQLKADYDKIEEIYSEKYAVIKKELGGQWAELMSYEHIYKNWDPLLSGISAILCPRGEIIALLPEAVKRKIGYVAALKSSNFTEKLCLEHDIQFEQIPGDGLKEKQKKFFSYEFVSEF